jgi:mRNA interferase RelE/StbE
MAYTVEYSPSAARQLKKLRKRISRDVWDRIQDVVESLAANPWPHGCEKLADETGYRVRVGDFRIAYDIDGRALVVLVFKVGDRKDVYKKKR